MSATLSPHAQDRAAKPTAANYQQQIEKNADAGGGAVDMDLRGITPKEIKAALRSGVETRETKYGDGTRLRYTTDELVVITASDRRTIITAWHTDSQRAAAAAAAAGGGSAGAPRRGGVGGSVKSADKKKVNAVIKRDMRANQNEGKTNAKLGAKAKKLHDKEKDKQRAKARDRARK